MSGLQRRSVVVTSLVVTGLVLLLLAQSQDAYGQAKKFSGTGKVVALLAETKMLPGDDPRHEITLVRRLDVEQSSDPDFSNAQIQTISVSDYVAGTGTHRGYRVATGATGDKWFVAYEGQTKTVPRPSGPPEITFDGKWRFTDGTGKFKGLTAAGRTRVK